MSERVPEEPGTPATPPAGGLLAELKRRGVVRAVVGYGVAAFAVLQVAEPILHALRLPDGWLTGVVVVLALGFPVTAALSWAFDLTRRGIVRTEEAVAAPASAPRSGRLTQAGVIALAAALGAALAWLALRTPAPVADADGRISVAVADFANQTGEAPLDALSGLLITSLEQSRKLKVLTRGRMFDLLRQGGQEKVERIDESAAREVGLKAGVRALLLASVVKLGGAYVVELRALDPVKDHYLFTLRERAADQAAILPLIDRLSERTRLELQEQAAEVKKADIQVAAAVTPNLEAYRHYFLGQQLVARMDLEEALLEFRAAVQGDPGFTAARLRLSHTGYYQGTEDLELAAGLLAGAEGLPAKERALAIAWGSLHAGNLARARDAAAPLIRAYQEDRDALLMGGDVLSVTGDLEGAVLAYRGVLALDRRNELALGNLVVTLFDAGRPAEALAVTADLGEPLPAWALLVASWSAGYAGDVDRAERLGRAAIEAGNKFDAFMMLSMAADARGDRADLQQALDETERRAEGAGVKAFQRGSVLAVLGRWREVHGMLVGAPPNARIRWNSVRAAAGAGQLGEAQTLARGLAPLEGWGHLVLLARLDDAGRVAAITAELPAGSYPRRLGEALQAWLRGEWAEALAALRALDTGSRSQVAWLRGTIAAELGFHEEAVEALARYQRLMRGGTEEMERIDMLPRARLQLARSLDALGRRAEAREAVRRQLDVWRDADPDFPLLAEAKGLCKQLGCMAP